MPGAGAHGDGVCVCGGGDTASCQNSQKCRIPPGYLQFRECFQGVVNGCVNRKNKHVQNQTQNGKQACRGA